MKSNLSNRMQFRGVALGSVFALIPLSSCGPPSADPEQPVLTVVQSSVSIGDSHIANDAAGPLSIIFTIYEALVGLDEEGSYQPALAERWEVAEDARTWTFHLRDGVRFHNGEVLDASDVVATLGRVLDPAIGGAFGTQGVYISYLGTAEISAPEDSMVRIVTEDPMADLLDLLVAMPISPASELDELPGEYVGSGPYEIVEQSDTRVVVAAHDEYWGKTPDYREIHWIAEGDSGKRVEALLNGQADGAAGIGIQGWQRITDAAGFDSSPRSTYRVLREKIHSTLQGPWWEGYENQEVDSLIEEAQATVSDTERQAIYRQIYTIIRDDAPWIFLYNPTPYWGVGPTMKDWRPRADGLLIFP